MQVVDGVMKTNVAAGKDLSEQHLSKRKRPSSMEGGRGCTVRLLIGYFETLTRPLVDCASSHLISSHLKAIQRKTKVAQETKKNLQEFVPPDQKPSILHTSSASR